jgi:hypothetical protein
MIQRIPRRHHAATHASDISSLLESAYRRELQNLLSKNVLARLWAKDTSLWPAEDYQAESMESNLG